MGLPEYMLIEQSPSLHGSTQVDGAKNAALVIMASSVLACGVTKLHNIPLSSDVQQMAHLLTKLGALVHLDMEQQCLTIDTSHVIPTQIPSEIMRKMRASILIVGPLLARFHSAYAALPGGCTLGARPIDFHLRAFAKMGAVVEITNDHLHISASILTAQTFVLEYPSVGATENIMMAAVFTKGITKIINAAIEPEVLDLIDILRKMGAHINVKEANIIEIEGVSSLQAVEHSIIPDRLEAGTLLLAAAITGGKVTITNASNLLMDVFLEKLSDMGHSISTSTHAISLHATKEPKAVSFRTMPYPGFPTDLQAPMMVAQCLASGISTIYETVFENRLMHVRELQKMGALITTNGPLLATVQGVEMLYGAHVIAPDIRASSALVLAGLVAQGQTTITGLHHFKRGYTQLDKKLQSLGAKITIMSE